MPFSSARPSLAPSTSGAGRPRASARSAGTCAPSTKTSPTPIMRRRHVRQRRQVARGADRTLARHHRRQVPSPAAPRAGARSRARTPDAPWARLASLSAIISRATATGIGAPTPAACDSTMLRWSRSRSAGVDAHAGELAEARVDAVDRLAPGEDGRDRPGRRVDRACSCQARGRPPRRDRCRATPPTARRPARAR